MEHDGDERLETALVERIGQREGSGERQRREGWQQVAVVLLGRYADHCAKKDGECDQRHQQQTPRGRQTT